ncbi:proteasome subunit beta type-5-like protein [Tanacetum coccineum]|uniref:Proteasome subunit beta n=1 Tax=Tanacetum coccineum TaxID=301880 RepID=A0ABQ5F092_9ASTR
MANGVLPAIKFTHTFVSEMCKDAALAKELRDLSLCSAIPIPGYYKNKLEKYGMRKIKEHTRNFYSKRNIQLNVEIMKPDFSELKSSAHSTGEFDEYQKKSVQMVKPAKGITTVAFVFKDGVTVAADSRASMGRYISSQSVMKIIKINGYMLGTMAGGAADCQFWHRNLGTKSESFVDAQTGSEMSKQRV